MPKQTKLGDDAYFYQTHKKQTEKEKLREMNFKGKVNYLLEYYKLHALAIVIVIALIIYFIYTLFNPTVVPRFYAAMINNTIDNTVLKQYSDDFSEKLSLNPKRETVLFNTNFSFGTDDSYSASMKTALIAYIQAKEVDVIIAPEAIFYEYAYSGIFRELSDQLPTDIYSSLTDKFYLSDTEENKEKKVYGIYVTDTKLYKDHSLSTEPYILGILANSPNTENTIKFIRYLFNEQ